MTIIENLDSTALGIALGDGDLMHHVNEADIATIDMPTLTPGENIIEEEINTIRGLFNTDKHNSNSTNEKKNPSVNLARILIQSRSFIDNKTGSFICNPHGVQKEDYKKLGDTYR